MLKNKLEIFKNIILILVIGFLAYNCFWDINKEPLEKWDEKVYIDVTKSSIADNSFLVPKINSLEGEFDMLTFNDNYFYEKPPIWFWIAFVITKVFGFSTDYLRYISSISGFLTGLILIFIANKYLNKTIAIFCGLIFATTGHLFIMNLENIYSSHNIKSICLDILQILFITASQFFIVKYLEKTKETQKIDLKITKFNSNLFYIALFTSLGILTKGVFSFLPLFVFFIYLIFIKKENFLVLIKTFFYLSFYILIFILPWHIYMTFQGGLDFWNNYFFYHNLNRSFNAIEGHQEVWYFHIENFLNLKFFSSGIIFFLATLFFIIKKDFKNPVIFHFIFYTLICLFLATLIQTKLSWYALYIYPGAALISAWGYWILLKYTQKIYFYFKKPK